MKKAPLIVVPILVVTIVMNVIEPIIGWYVPLTWAWTPVWALVIGTIGLWSLRGHLVHLPPKIIGLDALCLAAGFFLGIVVSVFVGFAYYPTIMMKSPAYKEAARMCGSVKVGAAYKDIETQYGALFFQTKPIYFDKDGVGFADLKNNVLNFETVCRIEFEQYKVKRSFMSYTWL